MLIKHWNKAIKEGVIKLIDKLSYRRIDEHEN